MTTCPLVCSIQKVLVQLCVPNDTGRGTTTLFRFTDDCCACIGNQQRIFSQPMNRLFRVDPLHDGRHCWTKQRLHVGGGSRSNFRWFICSNLCNFSSEFLGVKLLEEKFWKNSWTSPSITSTYWFFKKILETFFGRVMGFNRRIRWRNRRRSNTFGAYCTLCNLSRRNSWLVWQWMYSSFQVEWSKCLRSHSSDPSSSPNSGVFFFVKRKRHIHISSLASQFDYLIVINNKDEGVNTGVVQLNQHSDWWMKCLSYLQIATS